MGERSATIEIAQLPGGYWLSDVTVRMPGWPDQNFRSELFHDAGEAMDWARLMIQTAVFDASGGG